MWLSCSGCSAATRVVTAVKSWYGCGVTAWERIRAAEQDHTTHREAVAEALGDDPSLSRLKSIADRHIGDAAPRSHDEVDVAVETHYLERDPYA